MFIMDSTFMLSSYSLSEASEVLCINCNKPCKNYCYLYWSFNIIFAFAWEIAKLFLFRECIVIY